ncbi:UNVERIFIED_CONTAM: protein TIME FOR COFFEE [Sesamum angustifolium]|uniref:Protein TIME FOR COFFEE n=1 Tax=Sesamum angustifolium TaxID=2727405 RepID=A0AAW2P120_9LAMI
MAPPPQVRSSPERETKIDFTAAAADQKPVPSILEADLKPAVSKDKEDEKGESGKDHSANVAAEVNASGNKVAQKQQQMPIKATKEETLPEKSCRSASSLPLPMSMTSWPGGLPPMGYMAPLQGVVSMDGTTVTPAPIQVHFLFLLCSSFCHCSHNPDRNVVLHCHIARNIHCLQQFMKMNSFWPPPAGSASLFGSKPCNLNVMPADLHGNISVRGVNNMQDKGQSPVGIPNNGGKEKGAQPAPTSDSAQRKQQILIQQALPQYHLGPAFIFPLGQQQAAVAARTGASKSPAAVASSNSSSSAGASVSAGAGAATTLSFNYPNMAANETQYLAILQNNAYHPFTIPAVGAPPNYRGAPAQPMPLFNGSFYSSPMIHPSQLQQPQPSSNQPQQLLQAHQHGSASSGSSSSRSICRASSRTAAVSPVVLEMQTCRTSQHRKLSSLSSYSNRIISMCNLHDQDTLRVNRVVKIAHRRLTVEGLDPP